MSQYIVGRSGHRYTLNGKTVTPRELVFVDMFKGRNLIAAGLWGKGGHHTENAKRYIADWREIGIRGFRIPPELRFWGPPYFDNPDQPNEKCFLNLGCGTGNSFYLPDGFKKQIRMMIRLAREMDVIFEVPWLWTIKGRGDVDPRRDVAVWNEHYIVAVGKYLHQLRTQGDGEAGHRVDAGGTNILSELANEYRVHADEFNDSQLRNIFRRWHTRDNPGELLGVSQSQPKHEYYPALDRGAESPDDIRIHTRRDGDWENAPDEIFHKFRTHGIPIFVNESVLHMTQSQWNYWIPKIPKWNGLATTDTNRFMRLHRGFWERGIYSTFHTLRGMDGGWPGWVPGRLEELIAEELNGTTPPPPPNRYKYSHIIDLAYDEILGREADDGGLRNYSELMGRGMSEADMRNALMRSQEFDDKFGEMKN